MGGSDFLTSIAVTIECRCKCNKRVGRVGENACRNKYLGYDLNAQYQDLNRLALPLGSERSNDSLVVGSKDFHSVSLCHNAKRRAPTTSPSISSLKFRRSLLFWPHNLTFTSCGSNSNGRGKDRSTITCSAERSGYAPSPTAKVLREILESPGVHLGPACFDALSAKLVERAGFQYCFTSGFSMSAARLALPDTGFLSYGEMLDQGQQITQAVTIPVIGDADDGYGNAMNVKRTVKGYIRAGFAGIFLEDQVSPKACGHTRGRKVVSREEAVMNIKAAIDARDESGSDIVIVARTDSRQAISLDEALWRSRAFADAGADVLFIDALASTEEMKAFCAISPLVPKMANMLEGGGKTPILSPVELEEIGYKLVAYPLSLMGVSIQAMQDALTAIKGGRVPPPGSMPTFDKIKEIVGFNAYYEEEKRYAISPSQRSRQRGYSSATANFYGDQPRSQDNTEQRSENDQDPVVEVVTPEVLNHYGAGSAGDPLSGIWSRTLRVKITGRDGFEKLDVRIPAGFLDGITNIVPALGGVNIKELLDDAAGEVGGKVLLDFNDTLGDRIQVFLE